MGQVGCLSWGQRDPVGTAWSKQVAPQRGQAQGPLIHSTPPLVPTGPWVASTSMDRIPRFGRQHSLGARVVKRGREGLYGRPSSLLHTVFHRLITLAIKLTRRYNGISRDLWPRFPDQYKFDRYSRYHIQSWQGLVKKVVNVGQDFSKVAQPAHRNRHHCKGGGSGVGRWGPLRSP